MNDSLRSSYLWRGELDSSSFAIRKFSSQAVRRTEDLPEP